MVVGVVVDGVMMIGIMGIIGRIGRIGRIGKIGGLIGGIGGQGPKVQPGYGVGLGQLLVLQACVSEMIMHAKAKVLILLTFTLDR